MKKLLLALTFLTMPIIATSFGVQNVYAAATLSKLGDLSAMRKIVADTLVLVNANDIKGAVKRITEYETAWDKNTARLKKLDTKTWQVIDEASDTAISTVRYALAKPDEKKKDLADLISALDNPAL